MMPAFDMALFLQSPVWFLLRKRNELVTQVEQKKTVYIAPSANLHLKYPHLSVWDCLRTTRLSGVFA